MALERAKSADPTAVDISAWFCSSTGLDYLSRVLELGSDGFLQVEQNAGARATARIGCNVLPSGSDMSRWLGTIESEYCREIGPLCARCPIHHGCEFFRRRQQDARRNAVPFIDLFCGAGGLSLGLEQSGFVPVLAVDIDESAGLTYSFNRPFLRPGSVVMCDIQRFRVPSELSGIPLVVGGPPCQGFSSANRQRTVADGRNNLYREFVRLLGESGARFCLMENVPGALSIRRALEQEFVSVGFLVAPIVVSSSDFGYPQNRRRVVWFGEHTKNVFHFTRRVSVLEMALRHVSAEAHRYCLWDAIHDLPAISARTVKNRSAQSERWGFTVSPVRECVSPYAQLVNGGILRWFVLNHRSKYNNARDIEIYSRMRPGDESDAPAIQDIMPYKRREGIFRDKFHRLNPAQPCRTITAHMYYDCHMYIHPTQARGLTPREAARVQGFPDDYFFVGLPNEWYRQVGDAVSPLVGRQLGQALTAAMAESGGEI